MEDDRIKKFSYPAIFFLSSLFVGAYFNTYTSSTYYLPNPLPPIESLLITRYLSLESNIGLLSLIILLFEYIIDTFTIGVLQIFFFFFKKNKEKFENYLAESKTTRNFKKSKIKRSKFGRLQQSISVSLYDRRYLYTDSYDWVKIRWNDFLFHCKNINALILAFLVGIYYFEFTHFRIWVSVTTICTIIFFLRGKTALDETITMIDSDALPTK